MKNKYLLFIVFGLVVISCRNQTNETNTTMENPFLKEWATPFGVPPFDEIQEDHYIPAVKEGIRIQDSEIQNIVESTEEPTFENTVLVLDKSGELLNKVASVFYPLNSANTNDNMQALAREISPLLTQHNDNISLNPELFARIKAIYEKRNERLRCM